MLVAGPLVVATIPAAAIDVDPVLPGGPGATVGVEPVLSAALVQPVITARLRLSVPATPEPAPATGTAAGTCTLRGPSQLSIGAGYQKVVFTLGSDCPAKVAATWELVHARYGFRASVPFPAGARSFELDWYPTMPLGDHTLNPAGAYVGGGGQYRQNAPKLSVRLRSQARLVVDRGKAPSGSTAMVRVAVSAYHQGRDAFVPWRAAQVRIQHRTCPTCPWTLGPVVGTNAAGVATARVSAPPSSQWRAVVVAEGVYAGCATSVRTG